MTDDLPPRPRRVAPTRRRELFDAADRIRQMEERGETLFGLPVEREAGPLSRDQLLASARKFHRHKQQAKPRRGACPRQRCI